jgi:NAD(P)-dependent dehydrogenase (short-subunit alcohol dehydrogenase family)
VKAALVTGGGAGIGLATVERLASDGWTVAAAEIDAVALKDAERAGAFPLSCDVSREADVKRAVAAAAKRFGALDAVVSNAGVSANKPLAELSLGDWNRVLAVNLTAAFLLAKHAAPHLARAKGSMVLVASTRALQSEPDTEAYSASKGGLVALTHALALSLGPDVRVNCVSPGWIDIAGRGRKPKHRKAAPGPADHAWHPAGRVGKPEDVAALVAWLLGAEAGFVTGANFVIDGGVTRKMVYP